MKTVPHLYRNPIGQIKKGLLRLNPDGRRLVEFVSLHQKERRARLRQPLSPLSKFSIFSLAMRTPPGITRSKTI